MSTTVTERPPLASTNVAPMPNPPRGDDLLEALALALEARGRQLTAGFEGIEHRTADEVLDAPAADSVFGWIGEELTALGVPGDKTTVGDILTAMGVVGGGMTGEDDQTAQHWAAHSIGCHCHGLEISAWDAADRVRQMKSSI